MFTHVQNKLLLCTIEHNIPFQIQSVISESMGCLNNVGNGVCLHRSDQLPLKGSGLGRAIDLVLITRL